MRLWATFATAWRVLSMVCLFLASLRLLTVLIPIWFTGIVDPKHQMTYLHYLLKTYYLFRFRFQNQAEARTTGATASMIGLCILEAASHLHIVQQRGSIMMMITPQT